MIAMMMMMMMILTLVLKLFKDLQLVFGSQRGDGQVSM